MEYGDLQHTSLHSFWSGLRFKGIDSEKKDTKPCDITGSRTYHQGKFGNGSDEKTINLDNINSDVQTIAGPEKIIRIRNSTSKGTFL